MSLLFFKIKLLAALLFDLVWFGVKTVFGTRTVIVFLLLLITCISAFILRSNFIQQQKIRQLEQQQQVATYRNWARTQIAIWEEQVHTVPSRVGYSFLAELYEYIGETEKAAEARTQAKELDPNYFSSNN